MSTRRQILKASLVGASAVTLPSIAGSRSTIRALADKLIDGSREQALEACVVEIKTGSTPEALLASLQTAAASSISPYPSVGFKFHAAMVPRSLHLWASALPGTERWLPVLWGVDNYKRSQQRQLRQVRWRLPFPATQIANSTAPERLVRAVDDWDLEAAEAARLELGASVPDHVFQALLLRGLRDYRDIGHKAIHAANCHRMAAFAPEIGQALLGSLVHALLNHGGDPDPSVNESWRDASWRIAGQVVTKPVNPEPQSAPDRLALEVLQDCRKDDAESMLHRTRARLSAANTVKSVWDGLFLAAGDMMFKRPGIIALHANTTLNACHYAFLHTDPPRERQRILLQGAALMIHFRDGLGTIDSGEGIETIAPLQPRTDAERDVFEVLPKGRTGARLLLGHLQAGLPINTVIDRARHLLIDKIISVHDCKYLEAVFENLSWLSPPWRHRYLVSAVSRFKRSTDQDNDEMSRAKRMLKA
jgi:hypothetical protein